MYQKTEWGHINWIHAQNTENQRQSLSVGITYLLPGKRLQKHIHYGIDQFLYILDGEGIYIINGVEKRFRKGKFFYLEADTSHETINTGTVPVREFMVSHPVDYNSEVRLNNDILDSKSQSTKQDMNNMIYSAVEAIRTQLLRTISFPFTIFDDMWSIVIQNNNFSNYCISKCNPLKNRETCDCMLQRDFDFLDNDEGIQFTCKNGLAISQYQIVYNGKCIGTIRGGYILISDLTTGEHEGLYDSPRSTIIGINSILKQMVRSIISYCAFNASRRLLEEKDKALSEVLINNKSLKRDLYTINSKVTNLRINHHFLFNTLNSLASMSLVGNRDDLYNAIIDLSKMFRYTMTVDLKFISLSSEIENLETYLNLQRLRYEKGLVVQYDIDETLENIIVPFNFLQPIVENAFIHGFSSYHGKKIIKIKVEKINSRAKISIVNNGIPLNEIDLNRINRSLKSNTGHGLALIYEKLKSAYGKKFKIKVVSDNVSETSVVVDLPIFYEENRL